MLSAGLANGGELQPASSEAELKEKLRHMVEAQKAIDPDYAKLKGAPPVAVLSGPRLWVPIYLCCGKQDWSTGDCLCFVPRQGMSTQDN